MDYQIVNRDEFQVTGKMIRVSFVDGEDIRLIPQFWNACESDGTVERLGAGYIQERAFGICSTDYQREELTYAIAVESDVPTTDKELVSYTFPLQLGLYLPQPVLPSTIQDVWRRIFEEWFPATSYQRARGFQSSKSIFPEIPDPMIISVRYGFQLRLKMDTRLTLLKARFIKRTDTLAKSGRLLWQSALSLNKQAAILKMSCSIILIVSSVQTNIYL